jgi:predicted membrane-bound mannosyltransferase
MNKINISTIGLFYTPKTQDELFDWIERLPTSERVAATTAYGMTWNYLATQINEAQKDDDQD